MATWIRNDPCAICGKPVVFDDKSRKFTCGCGTVKAHMTPATQLTMFKRKDAE